MSIDREIAQRLTPRFYGAPQYWTYEQINNEFSKFHSSYQVHEAAVNRGDLYIFRDMADFEAAVYNLGRLYYASQHLTTSQLLTDMGAVIKVGIMSDPDILTFRSVTFTNGSDSTRTYWVISDSRADLSGLLSTYGVCSVVRAG